jgi:hypothetical protein
VTTRAPVTGTKDTLEVFLDIKQGLCLGEPIFSEIDTETGKISISASIYFRRLDLSSVVFYDQQLFFVDRDAIPDFAVTYWVGPYWRRQC